MGVYNIQKEINKWNIDYSYTVGTQVVFNGKLFIAKQNVPKGINLGMGEYWRLTAANHLAANLRLKWPTKTNNL